ncbi:MAG: HAMP domain-containing sensor histidine kinase [Gemmatimonadales bacterium]
MSAVRDTMAGAASEDGRPRANGVSLQRKLPLLMTAVLLVILAGGVLLAYREVRVSAELVAVHRVQEVADQIARLVETSGPRLGERLRPIAADSTVLRALTSPQPSTSDLNAVRQNLTYLETPADSALVSELWSADGRVLVTTGDSLSHRGRPTGAAVSTGRDSVSIGAFYSIDARVYYWSSLPVTMEGRRVGTLAQRRRLNAQPNTERDIARLAGQDVRILFHNADGSLWTTLGGKPVAPPWSPLTIGTLKTYQHPEVAPGSGRMLLQESRVAGTPWVAAIEIPVTSLGNAPRQMLRRFTIASLVLLLLGAIAVWFIVRRMISPLARMTAAAEGIAKGDYSQRVEPRGRDEIARLGASFNRMASEIEAAERELQASAQSAEQAQITAEAANAAKGNFLAAMSHELRTPLNAIAGYVDLLDMGLRGPLTAEQRTDLGRIKRSQEYLLGLIEEVLVFTQLDAHQLGFRMQDVSVDAVMRDAETMVEPQIRARGVDYSYLGCDPGLKVRADREKTQQIVLNLLTNGAKYTNPGGAVTVSCDSRNGSVHVRVTDTGAGIPEAMLTRIFEPFVQLDRRLNQPREGVGLGLTISRDLARAMGGDLLVESTVGVGSTFTLVLPRTDAPASS